MIERKVWLPVRCCCTPRKIFGFLQLPEDALRIDVITLGEHRIEIKRFSENKPLNATPKSHADWHSKVERAVYSDDRPIEFWRALPGFIEALGEMSA